MVHLFNMFRKMLYYSKLHIIASNPLLNIAIVSPHNLVHRKFLPTWCIQYIVPVLEIYCSYTVKFEGHGTFSLGTKSFIPYPKSWVME